MKLLIIGQTPPPYGGQTINIEKIVVLLKKNNYDFKFVRLDFSNELNETGKLNFTKIWRLVKIFFSICYHLIFYRPTHVYYPVAGPNKVPVIRDIILLLPIRLLRKKMVFHFHAGGLSEIYPLLGPAFKALYRLAYFSPYHSICMSLFGKRDPEFLHSKQISVIPYGVTDPGLPAIRENVEMFNVLFVAVCKESKGILDFIKVLRIVKETNNRITGTVMGEIPLGGVEELAIKEAVTEGLIKYEGVKVGLDKQLVFKKAHVFLFPTFFEAENFPTVNLEAFSFGLPVISTKWRGVSDQVQEQYNGFLHDVHDTNNMAASVLLLANNQDLYKTLCKNARITYEANYTSEQFDKSILTQFNLFQ